MTYEELGTMMGLTLENVMSGSAPKMSGTPVRHIYYFRFHGYSIKRYIYPDTERDCGDKEFAFKSVVYDLFDGLAECMDKFDLLDKD